jgi:uncharacterized protein
MHILYLHGFASSAQSSKASFLAARLKEHGVHLDAPDLNQPDFATLTISRMVKQVSEEIDARPRGDVVLVGSSLGGFVAVQTALARPDRVAKVVLLAPALDFGGNRMRDLGDRGLTEWERTGQLNVFHYGFGRTMSVHYELYRDACGYDCVSASLTMPILIFQGRRDTAVDPEAVERWASSRPNVELHMLDDDHQLLQSLPFVWERMRGFLDLRNGLADQRFND